MTLGNVRNRKMTELKIAQRVDDEGGQIAYDDAGGPGRLVLCLPGMGQLRSLYRFVVPKLRDQGFRVVTMDVRGMGDSSTRWTDYSESAIASDAAVVIERLQSGPALILGNSISAGAAVCLASDHPELVSGLVLIGPFVRQIPVPWWKVLTFRIALAGPWGRGMWVNYQTQKLYPSSKPADISEYNNALRKNLKEPGRMSAFQRMASTDHKAAELRLGNVQCPVLVVMGGADPDFPDPEAEGKLVAQKLRGELVVLPGLGHYPQAEQPEEFLQPVMNFFRGIREQWPLELD
jgi:pimeloyl-ACP methyl ester carboxylesterase